MIDRIDREVDRTFSSLGLTQEEAEQTRAVLGRVFDQLEASTDDERKLLTAQMEKLEAERLKLVQAHYADAIPLDLLKKEQARFTTNLEALKRRLEVLATTYRGARDGLDRLANLITDLGVLYRRCELAARHILLRAVCKKIVIDENENISYVPSDAVAVAKSPVGQQKHADSVVTDQSITTETSVRLGEVSNFSHLVELTGFEPVTFCMPCRRATNCAIAPKFFGVAVATPAILHAHWAAAKSGGRFSDVSLTHPAPSRARLTSTTARWQLPIPARP